MAVAQHIRSRPGRTAVTAKRSGTNHAAYSGKPSPFREVVRPQAQLTKLRSVTQPVAQLIAGLSLVQLKGEDLTTEEADLVKPMVRDMGITWGKITVKKWDKGTSRCIGSTMYISRGLFNRPQELRFVLGHELSHYMTRDNEVLGLSTWLTTGLTYLASWADIGLFGGFFSSSVIGAFTYLTGGGLVNALIHAFGAASSLVLIKIFGLLGFGVLSAPLVSALLMLGTSTLLTILRNLTDDKDKETILTLATCFTPEVFAQVIIETKADIHSIVKMGAKRASEGGLKHFMFEYNEKVGGLDFDPLHPPLWLRMGYLAKIAGLKTRKDVHGYYHLDK